MPTYQYACQACDEQFEVVQSFSDDTLSKHDPGCGGSVRKVYGSVGVVFKGSGFYRTDSRSGSTASESAKSEKSEGKSESTSASKSETKTESSSTKSDSSSSSSGSPSTKSDGGSSSASSSSGKTAA